MAPRGFFEHRKIPRVGQGLSRVGEVEPASVVDLVSKRQLSVSSAASASTAPVSSEVARLGTPSPAALRGARSGAPSPPRPLAVRRLRRFRPARPFPSGTSSRRTSDGGRRAHRFPTRRGRGRRRPQPGSRSSLARSPLEGLPGSWPLLSSLLPAGALSLREPPYGIVGFRLCLATTRGFAPRRRTHPDARPARPAAPSPRRRSAHLLRRARRRRALPRTGRA